MVQLGSDCAQLDRLFDELIDASETKRAAMLSTLQSRIPQQHEQLLQLLEMAKHPCSELDPEQLDRRAAWQALGGSIDVVPADIGDRIGAWRLVRHLGRGGMGDVYEVARADGVYLQQAALKLILGEIDSREFLDRFSRERQILAVLAHPGIARLLDGGEDARGRPFFVMEFIEGSSIDVHCETRRLDLRTRLELFLQVLGAVEHAHRHRVVHRDLKPSNIAVTATGQAKLLDFGIAKVLSGDDTEQPAARTRLLLTPQYSTPEQVSGRPVDFSSDIYQLGLLLFELLTGQRAQEPIDGTPGALLQAVCVDNRAPPSACVANAPMQDCAKIGNLKPAALARQLRGDLDWIVLKALRQDPARRYASVQAFSDDVQRYLRGAPVSARPETFAYRAGKFVRLHPWGVASTTLAFLLIAAYALTATFQAQMIAAERDRAALQARKAEQVKTLVLRMFEGANPEYTLGRPLTARELLDSSWPLIESETNGQPQLQIELLDTLGETYRRLGEYDQALKRLHRARQLIEAHPELPPQVAAVSSRTMGRLLTDRGEFEQAATALHRAQRLFQQSGANVAELAATLMEMGQLHHRRGQDADAEALYLAAIDLYQKSSGDHRRALADTMERLAVAYSQQAKYAQAAPMLQETLRLQQQLLPKDHPDLAGNQASLAEAWRQLGRHAAAETLYRESLASMQRSLGDRHPHVATVMNNLARTLKALGNFAAAERLHLNALAIRRAQLGARDPLVAMSLNDLGSVLLAQGKLTAADSRYREALSILPAEHPGRGGILANLGSLLQTRGDITNAEQLYREALPLRRAHLGDDHDLVANILRQLGEVLHAQGRDTEAATVLREALRIFRLHFNSADPRLTEVSRLLSELVVPAATRVGPADAH